MYMGSATTECAPIVLIRRLYRRAAAVRRGYLRMYLYTYNWAPAQIAASVHTLYYYFYYYYYYTHIVPAIMRTVHR